MVSTIHGLYTFRFSFCSKSNCIGMAYFLIWYRTLIDHHIELFRSWRDCIERYTCVTHYAANNDIIFGQTAAPFKLRARRQCFNMRWHEHLYFRVALSCVWPRLCGFTCVSPQSVTSGASGGEVRESHVGISFDSCRMRLAVGSGNTYAVCRDASRELGWWRRLAGLVGVMRSHDTWGREGQMNECA